MIYGFINKKGDTQIQFVRGMQKIEISIEHVKPIKCHQNISQTNHFPFTLAVKQ